MGRKRNPGFPLAALRTDAALALGCFALALVVRSWSVAGLEPYVDEEYWLGQAAALRWLEPASYFHSVYSEGRPPLYSWLAALSLSFFSPPILAGRLASAVAGAAATAGLFLLAARLFGRLAGALAAVLYAIAPLALFFDRAAVDDSTLAACSVWALMATVHYFARPTLARSAALGVALAAAFLAKTLGLMLVVVPLVGLWLLAESRSWRRSAGYLPATYALLAVAVLGLWQLGGETSTVSYRDHAMPLEELMALPLGQWQENLLRVAEGWAGYLLPAVAPLAAIGAGLGLVRGERGALFLVALPVLVSGALGLLSINLFTRYLHAVAFSGFALAGYGLVQAAWWAAGLLGRPSVGPWVSLGGVAALAATTLPATWAMVTNPTASSLEVVSRQFQGPYSGVGLRRAVERVLADSGGQDVLILSAGGLPSYVPLMTDQKQLHLKYESAVACGRPLGFMHQHHALGLPIYFFSNESYSFGSAVEGYTRGCAERIPLELPDAVELARIDRPGGKSWIRVFRLDPGEPPPAEADVVGLWKQKLLRITDRHGESLKASVATGSEAHAVVWAESDEKGPPEIWFMPVAQNRALIRRPLVMSKSGVHTDAPRVVWLSDRYGVVWEDRRHGAEELYFREVYPEGWRLGPELRLTFSAEQAGQHSTNPVLGWNGQELALAFDRHLGGGNFEVFFQRLLSDGQALGPALQVSASAEPSRHPRLAWSPVGWGMVWDEGTGAGRHLRYALLDSSGGVLSEATLRFGRVGSPNLLWDEGRFAIAYLGEGSRAVLSWFDLLGGVQKVVVVADPVEDSCLPALARSGQALLVTWCRGAELSVSRIEGGIPSDSIRLRPQGPGGGPAWPALSPDGSVAVWSDQAWGWTEVVLAPLDRFRDQLGSSHR